MKTWTLILVLLMKASIYSSLFTETEATNSTTVSALTEATMKSPVRSPDTIFCVVFTGLIREGKLYMHKVVKDLYGHQCNHVLYAGIMFTDAEGDTETFLKLQRDPGFGGIMEALKFIYNNSMTFDWILVATDGTLVLMDHLRDFIAQQDLTEKPVHFGYREVTSLEESFFFFFSELRKVDTFSIEAGFVMNLAGFKSLVQSCKFSRIPYRGFRTKEDVLIGRCLEDLLESKMLETVDEFGREKFHKDTLDATIDRYLKAHRNENTTYKQLLGYYSKHAITFYADYPGDMMRMNNIIVANDGSPVASTAKSYAVTALNFVLQLLLVPVAMLV